MLICLKFPIINKCWSSFFSPSLTIYVGASHFWTPTRLYNKIRPEVCPKASKVLMRNLRSVPEAPKILSRHLKSVPEASKVPIGYLSSVPNASKVPIGYLSSSSEASKLPIRYVGSVPEASKVPSSCFRSVTEEKYSDQVSQKGVRGLKSSCQKSRK